MTKRKFDRHEPTYTRQLGRNAKWEGGMLFGGTDIDAFVMWIDMEQYVHMGRPTRIEVQICTMTPSR